MGHGNVADEIKGRAAQFAGGRAGAILAIEEEGVPSAPTSTARSKFMGPETSMAVQAALGSDIALVFDECTPFHAGRDYTARSTERTHRWLDRCLEWHTQHGPDGQLVYGIVQGGPNQDPRRGLGPGGRRARRLGGIAIGGSLGEDKAQMFEVVEWTVEELPEGKAAPPARDRRGRRPGARRRARASTRSTARCRPGSAATAWRSCPTRSTAGASTSRRRAGRDSDEPLLGGCPCPACTAGYSRAYLHYLFKAKEQTAMRLLTIHNLAFLQRLMAELRDSIDEGRLAGLGRRRGPGWRAAPWELGAA